MTKETGSNILLLFGLAILGLIGLTITACLAFLVLDATTSPRIDHTPKQIKSAKP